MNAEDTARCQQAIEIANAGQKQVAYQQFEELYYLYPKDVTLLYWIAYTTPSVQEAQDMLAILTDLEPDHPKLAELRGYVARMQHKIATPPIIVAPTLGAPILQCPYCHHAGPARIQSKIASGGWVFFVVFLFLFFPICWIGFLIRKNYYACNFCGITLGDIS